MTQAAKQSMRVHVEAMLAFQKMGVPVLHGVDDKAERLRQYLAEKQIDPQTVVFLGNDFNDTPCFPLVGCAVAVADAQVEALREADLVLERPGGHGAVRELCDLLYQRIQST